METFTREQLNDRGFETSGMPDYLRLRDKQYLVIAKQIEGRKDLYSIHAGFNSKGARFHEFDENQEVFAEVDTLDEFITRLNETLAFPKNLKNKKFIRIWQ